MIAQKILTIFWLSFFGTIGVLSGVMTYILIFQMETSIKEFAISAATKLSASL